MNFNIYAAMVKYKKFWVIATLHIKDSKSVWKPLNESLSAQKL